jgi:hypothetical protein
LDGDEKEGGGGKLKRRRERAFANNKETGCIWKTRKLEALKKVYRGLAGLREKNAWGHRISHETKGCTSEAEVYTADR